MGTDVYRMTFDQAQKLQQTGANTGMQRASRGVVKYNLWLQ